jgi:putative membrane protein
VLLVAVVSIATIWFAVGGRLDYYVHPRYLVFTVAMASIALALCAARAVMIARTPAVAPNHDHDHDDDDPPPATRSQAALSGLAVLIAVAVAVGIIVFPPATLSSATALQRDLTGGSTPAGGSSLSSAQSASNAAFATFTVLDWSSLLHQTTDVSFYAGKPVAVEGFITPSPTDGANTFYLTRFVITCCAVDAQPVGVPVYLPNWRSSYKNDEWLSLAGGFEANRSTTSSDPIALVPSGVKKINAPNDPYLY